MTRSLPSHLTLIIVLITLFLAQFLPPKAHAQAPAWSGLGGPMHHLNPDIMKSDEWERALVILRNAPNNGEAIKHLYRAQHAASAGNGEEAMQHLNAIYGSGLSVQTIVAVTQPLNALRAYYAAGGR